MSHDIYTFDACNEDMFDCKDGTCIDFEKMCNGVKDCQNGKDESSLCESSCKNHPCEQKCQKTPDGPICGCEKGYNLDSNRKNCTDVDECTTKNPCSQKCFNLVGSYRCSCFSDYILEHDKISCKAMGDSVYMLFNTFDQIRMWTNKPLAKLSVPLEFNNSKVIDFDVNVQKNQALFTLKETSAIHKVDLLTSKVEVAEETGVPEKISLDWITGNVYFTGKIFLLN